MRIAQLRLNLLVLWLLSGTAVAGETLTKNDFAYGIDVTVDDHMLYEFTVNDEIYDKIQHGDLRDLRIFDARGALAPLRVIAPSSNEKTQSLLLRDPHNLTFFSSAPTAPELLRL